MAKPRNDLIDRLQYLGLRLVSMTLHCYPISWSLAGASLLGDVWYYAVKKHRLRALENLRRSFPEKSLAERERIARHSIRQFFQLGVEMMFTPRLVRIDTWRNYVSMDDIGKTLGLLLDGGSPGRPGLIMLTGHYGNWEVLGYLLATLGFPTSSVARPLDNPYVSEFVYGIREKKGQRILDKTGALSEVPDVLEGGGAVGFIADQNAGSKGMFVEFFGRQASTYKSIGLLALRYNVPVIIGYARRRKNQFHFDVGTQDIIYPADWADQDDPLRYITQRYTKAIEDFVRADPGQYLWVHRRWKTRPKGEPPDPES